MAATASRARVAAATGRPADAAASALRWLGRGQSYAGLVREIAWTAVRAVDASERDLEWIAPLVDAQLAQRFDELPRVVREVAPAAEAEHLRLRPHDRDGADVAAELAAHDAAVEHLSTAYLDTLDWGVSVLQERHAEACSRFGGWRRRFGKRSGRPAVPCEVPQRIVDGLTLGSERPGWRDRSAA